MVLIGVLVKQILVQIADKGIFGVCVNVRVSH